MSRIKFAGPWPLRMSSLVALNGIAVATCVLRLLGRRIEPSWSINTEIGVRFWRRQFTRAMLARDIQTGRKILDSLQTETPDNYSTDCRAEQQIAGTWHLPRQRTSAATLLYFHGGGYTFHGAMNVRFAEMLAHRLGAPVFAPDYPLTPEHPHPAQIENAMAAWAFLSKKERPEHIVVIGDSAGGHLMLSLLLRLKNERQAQPALGIGLCPWTDIGDSGGSLHANDRYDLVQGWMALCFGQWLDPYARYGREALSPAMQNFDGVAPLYLQAGGREILHDQIEAFAQAQRRNGADVLLDVWPAMPHDFQLFDSTQRAATDAIDRMRAAIRAVIDGDGRFEAGPMTKVVNGRFFQNA